MCRRLTICDGIERCLKKGRGGEQASAAQLAVLLCIQLGVSDLTDQVCHDLKPLLVFTILDNSASPVARAKVSGISVFSRINDNSYENYILFGNK